MEDAGVDFSVDGGGVAVAEGEDGARSKMVERRGDGCNVRSASASGKYKMGARRLAGEAKWATKPSAEPVECNFRPRSWRPLMARVGSDIAYTTAEVFNNSVKRTLSAKTISTACSKNHRIGFSTETRIEE